MTRHGYYGEFGGRFVPETLMEPLQQLEHDYKNVRRDPTFRKELQHYLRSYGGRPTPIYHCRRLSERLGGAQIWLKREDLVHGGAHKFNNVMGQALLARRMGRTRLIAETGAGQHGVATAMAGAVLGLPVTVYMGRHDTERQRLNVFRMSLLGAKVVPVDAGAKTLKDAINEALRDWVANPEDTYYLLGSVVGPHPYPRIVRDFQSVIGREIRVQAAAAGIRPEMLIACVGGGSNAAGTFAPFVRKPKPLLVGVEAGGSDGKHSASLTRGRPGVLHGAYTFLLQDKEGQIRPAHSISAGLDYPGVGPEHAHWKETGRVRYVTATDRQAVAAFKLLCETEGILPALESAHALAYATRAAPTFSKKKHIVVTLSGRGDKDVEVVAEALGVKI